MIGRLTFLGAITATCVVAYKAGVEDRSVQVSNSLNCSMGSLETLPTTCPPSWEVPSDDALDLVYLAF